MTDDQLVERVKDGDVLAFEELVLRYQKPIYYFVLRILRHPLEAEDTVQKIFLLAYQNIKGFSLKDHLPAWQPCWSFWLNDETIVKHRLKGGVYAGYNNVKAALGANIVTGHTHVLAVQPLTGYQKTFYGVQTGTLAHPKGNQFIDYTEDAPVDWRSGFAMLTFHKGRLLMPELFQVHDENDHTIEFRGKVFGV